MDGATKVKFTLIAVAVGGVMLYNYLFVDKDEVREFNNRLVALVSVSDNSFAPAMTRAEALSHGQFDPASLPEAEKIARTAARQLAKVSEMQVPPEDLARTFHSACVDYLKIHVTLANAWHDGLKKVAGAEGEAVPAAIEATLNALGTNAEACEKQLDVVRKEQRELADKFNLDIEK